MKDRRGRPKTTWTHTICEKCWFKREPEHYPAQVNRERGDITADQCCFCGTLKVTRIYIREAPESELLLCGGQHHEED